VIRDKEVLVSDPLEVTKRVTKLFREWFFRSDKDAWRDHNISDSIICDEKDKFLETTRSLNLKDEVSCKVWESCRIREISEEAGGDMNELCEYTPSYDEFLSFIQSKPKIGRWDERTELSYVTKPTG